ncbi:MAG: hypothetical protein ABI348_01075 [Nitrososphaera sp.]
MGLAYVVRVKEEQERTLYARQWLYVGIRRDWSAGSKILLVRKNAHGDSAIGSATLEKVVELDALSNGEKKLCLENNWYGKMVFAMLARFLPAVPVSETPLAGRQPALLHGLAITDGELSRIESLAGSKIIT